MGYNSSFLRHNCLDKGCYLKVGPSWDGIIKAFPRNIRPTDIDGMVEIGNHFLFLEEKKPGASLPDGQGEALGKLSKLPNVTVVAFRPMAKSDDLQWLRFVEGEGSGWLDVDRDEFHHWMGEWARKADGGEC